MPKVKKILLALQEHLNIDDYQGLAKHFGINRTTMYSWIKRDSIGDPGKILGVLPYLNHEWLKTGNGPMMTIDESTGGSRKEMNITGDHNTQSGKNTGPRNVHVASSDKEKMDLSTDEQYLIHSLRKLQKQDEILQDLIFLVLQHQREQKKEEN